MVTIKTEEELKIIAEGGKILAKIVKNLEKMAKPGITTKELNRAAEALVLSFNAKPAFKGYLGFPYSLCTSLNENIVHGFPSDYALKEGDLLKLDMGLLYKGFNTDMAATVAVGKISPVAKKLINTTKKSLELGIKQAKVGNTLGDIGQAIQEFVEGQGFFVIRELCGHGIGKSVHEDPQVLNFGKKGEGEKLVEGMVFCIEPMVAMGSYNIKKSKDGYGYATADNSLSAHFEHTIAITKKGPVILTRT